MKVARLDYHVHESYSSDAREGSVDRYILVAERWGIQEIVFTTHQVIMGRDYDFGIQPGEIPEYIENIHRLNDTTDVNLKVGLELDYFPEAEKQLEALIEEHPFDFVLGSIHYVGEYDVGARRDVQRFFSGRSLSEATSDYFAVWRKAVESGLFDVMAHPDYWRKFLHLVRPEPATFSEYGSVNEAIDSLVSYDVGIEVNTSGIRHPPGVQYPIREFLEEAVSAGVNKVTVGSDSHTPSHLGFWIPESIDMLKDIGLKHISRFKNRKHTTIEINSCVRTMKTNST
jgi:histidinol-phosphatase (PHP family)